MYNQQTPTGIQNQQANWNRPNWQMGQTNNPNYIQNNPNYNMSQYQQNFYARPELPGRIVDNVQDIIPNEVPMNGQVGLFPQKDYSCIYAKAWNSNGTIDTVVYVPYKEEQKVIDEPSESEKIMNRLDALQNMINELSEMVSTNINPKEQAKRTTKKEVTQNA